jgi:hypothetical protein
VDINRALDTIRVNIKISTKQSLGHYKLKKHKPWFVEGCSKETSQVAVDTSSKQNKFESLNNIRCVASKHFKKEERKYLKYKISELATNSKNKNIRDIYEYREINYGNLRGITKDKVTL